MKKLIAFGLAAASALTVGLSSASASAYECWPVVTVDTAGRHHVVDINTVGNNQFSIIQRGYRNVFRASSVGECNALIAAQVGNLSSLGIDIRGFNHSAGIYAANGVRLDLDMRGSGGVFVGDLRRPGDYTVNMNGNGTVRITTN